MIRPQLTTDGTALRLVDDRPDALLDDLARAYADAPAVVGRLLALHGRNVETADEAETSSLATDYGRAMAHAEADGSREALYGELTPPAVLDHVITPREAFDLADTLTARAARAYLAQNGTTA